MERRHVLLGNATRRSGALISRGEKGRGVVRGALVDGALRRVRSGVVREVGVGVDAGVGVGVRGRGEVGRSWTIILFGHAVGGGPIFLEIVKKKGTRVGLNQNIRRRDGDSKEVGVDHVRKSKRSSLGRDGPSSYKTGPTITCSVHPRPLCPLVRRLAVWSTLDRRAVAPFLNSARVELLILFFSLPSSFLLLNFLLTLFHLVVIH